MPQESQNFCVSFLIVMFFFLANFVASDHTIAPLRSPASSPLHFSLPPHSQGGRLSAHSLASPPHAAARASPPGTDNGLIDGEDLFQEITSLPPSQTSPGKQESDISLWKTPAAAPSPSIHAPALSFAPTPDQSDAKKENYDEDQSPAPSPVPFADQAADIYESFLPDQESLAPAPWMDAVELIFSPANSPSDYGDDEAADLVEEEGSSRRSRVSGAVAGALLGVGLVGLGGFVYSKRKNSASDVVTRGHYQSVGRNVV